MYMESIVEEFKNCKTDGIPMHLVDSEFMEDETYRYIKLYEEGCWSDEANKLFPETKEYIKHKFGDRCRQAFFVTMCGPKFMAPHKNEDNTTNVMRYHLGIVVHEECDGVLNVDDTQHKWKVGESFIFDTRQTHSVYKSSDYQRTILVVDFEEKVGMLGVINKWKRNILEYLQKE